LYLQLVCLYAEAEPAKYEKAALPDFEPCPLESTLNLPSVQLVLQSPVYRYR
jgi:hypothetical protein